MFESLGYYFVPVVIILCLFGLKKWMSGTQFTGSKHSLRRKVAVVTGGASGIGA